MQPDQVSGERRPATVLFVDVVGSTSLAERLDPEDWASTMEQAMRIMTEAVERYDGWVAAHTGDGLMALFGLPSAHEDDPSRAVTSASEMIASMERFAVGLRQQGVDFQVRVGINTGEVVVREGMASGATRDSRIYGDTLNVAARVQSEAPPGGILVTGETYARLGAGVESRHIGPIAMKGKAQPVEVYEIIGLAGALRTTRGIVGLHSPMVGRDADLARLVAALSPVRGGLGRMGLVVGEPGIGKSRLLAELREIASAEGLGWVQARTVSYGHNLPLHLAIDLVRALVDLPDPLESIPADEASRRLHDRLEEVLDGDAGDHGPILSDLLSLPLDPVGADRLAHMEPHTRQLRYAEAISRLVAATARSRPTIIVCDDVHWADDASVDLLQPLLETIATLPVLWLLASRAERDVPGWRLMGAARDALGDALIDIRLEPLDTDQGEVLVSHLLAIDLLPAPTRELILARAAGNPLFVEEIVRALIDQAAIELRDGRWHATHRAVSAEIPATLHGLLLARIDRLRAEARRVLRVASVIGRTFSVDVLERVVGARIGGELSTLEGAGLIGLDGSAPQLEYHFRHALIQDAAYESLLKQERRVLHARVADILLELFPEHQDDLAAVLAHHFERAEEPARALESLARAARHAQSRYARHEAVEFARRAVAMLPDDELLDAPMRRLRSELLLIEADAGVDFVPMHDTLALLDTVIADGDALGDPSISAMAYLLVARLRSGAGEQYRSSPTFAAALERARDLAARSGSPSLMALAVLATGHAHFAASEFAEAVDALARAVPALVDTGQIYRASVAAGHAGVSSGHLGAFDRAVAWTERAFQLGVESGDPNASLDADLGRAMVEALRGDTVAAVEYANRAAAAAERVDNKACAMVAHAVIGEQHLRDGDAPQAAIAFEASADLAAFCQFMPVKIEQTQLLLQTARARSGVGQVEIGRYDVALELARRFGDRLAEAQLYEQRAHDRMAAGQSEGVTEDLTASAALFTTLGATADVQRVAAFEEGLPGGPVA